MTCCSCVTSLPQSKIREYQVNYLSAATRRISTLLVKPERLLARVCLPLVMALLLPVPQAQAQISPQVAKGLSWLQTQVAADGSLMAESASLATPLQSRSETLSTLKLLNGAPGALGQLQGALLKDADNNTEYLARRAGALAYSGLAQAELIEQLQLRQNADGGFGGGPGYGSNARDTAFVLRAQKESPAFAAGALGKALAYLVASRNQDGSYGNDGPDQFYTGVQALLAASAWPGQPGAGEVAVKGQQWLLAQRNASLLFGSAHANAMGLWALTGVTRDGAILQPLVDALHAEQLADGSWNGDPYVTAIALRALYRVTQAPASGGGGATVHGTVIDAAGGAALANVTVQAGSTSISSDARGQFALASLPAGTHTLRFSRLGYANKDVAMALAAGQNVNIGSVTLSASSLTASIRGVISNSSGAPIAGALIAVGKASAVTDAQGAYNITGLSQDLATIIVAATNFKSVTLEMSIVAGNAYIFSPRLMETWANPPAANSVLGTVVDSVTKQAIAGAAIKLANLNATTSATGAYTLTPVAAGSFSIVIAANGYQGVTVSGLTVAGINNIGSVSLTKLPATSSLAGTVTDAATGRPVAAAVLRVEGQAPSAITGADGKYSLAGLSGTAFSLKVSASGYLAKSETITLSQAGAALADVILQPQALVSSDISFMRVETPSADYAATATIPLEIVLANGAAAANAVKVSALVINAQDNVVHEYQASPIVGWQGLSYGNNPVTVGANSTLALMLDWYAMRLPAGDYRIKAQALDTDGRLVAEADAGFTINSGSALAGGVTADPPLAQAGAKTQVSLTADLMNTGNVTLPAGDLKLKVVLESADPAETKPSDVVMHTIANGAPMSSPTRLKADAQGNMYTVNPTNRKVIRIAPNGAQTVLATLPAGMEPIDLALDPAGNVVVAGRSPARLYQVGPQGEVSVINLGTALLYVSALDIAADGTMFIAGKNNTARNRLISRSTAGVETILQDNGLASPHGIVKDGDGNYVVTSKSDGTLSKISSVDGSITPFASGISEPRGLAYGPDGNFYVAASASNKIVKVTPLGVVSDFASGLQQPYDVKFDQAGYLFVTTSGDNAIAKISPAGVVANFAQGVVNAPQALRYDGAGNLWSTNSDGTLRKLDTQEKSNIEANGLSAPRGLAIEANGDVLVADFGANRVYRVSNGVKTIFASGLLGPYGIAIDNAGVIHVTERDANRIVRFDSAGNKLGATESPMIAPNQAKAGAGGEVYVLGTRILSRWRNGSLEILQRNFTYAHWSPDRINGGLVAASGNTVVRVSDAGVVTTLKSALAFTPNGVAMAPDGAILLLDAANRKVHALSSDGSSLNLYATLAGAISANQLQSDAAGNVFVRLQSGAYQRLLADGTPVPVLHSIAEHMYDWSVAGDGQLVIWANLKTYRVDALAGTTSVWLANRGAGSPTAVSYATGDNLGNLLVIDSRNSTATHVNGSGVEIARQAGFQLPLDIVWTGSEMRFVDFYNHLYSFTGNAYPIAKAGDLPATYLAHVGNDTFGSSSSWINKWTGVGSGYATHTVLTGGITGLAARSDGGLAVADTTGSRVMIIDSSKVVVKDYAGLINPQGMVFDQAGRLYVANYGGGTIARFASSSSPSASTFSRLSNPAGLTLDDAGLVIVSRQTGVTRLAADGSQSIVTPDGSFVGILGDGGAFVAVDYATSQLRKLRTVNGVKDWPVFASGLNQVVGMRAAPDGSVYLLNANNNAVVKYSAGKVDAIATVPAGMNAIELSKAGVVSVAGNGGAGIRVGANRVATDLGLSVLAANFAIRGLYDAPDGKLYALGSTTEGDEALRVNTLFEMSITAPTALPPVGTVVYQTSLPMAELEANGSYAHVDFGKWVPPYGGDFKIEVYRDGVVGTSTNFIHVGPNAQSSLTAASTVVPPGDSDLGMCFDLKGADFSSISRVEMGQVRKVGSSAGIGNSGFPKGMAGDRAGNVYVTSDTALYRTNGSGVNTLIAGGMTLGFGLATDREQNFYVASRNAVTTRYELIRIDLAGVKTVIADLGPNKINGVQLNSKDEVLVGAVGKLMKVDKQGVVTIVSTTGLTEPRGLAVDGRDNVYVQNEGNKVSMIKPDGTTTSIYSKADGVVDPIFEGDGYPNIAADCADNFYIAPYTWTKLNQNGEEHSLAQVVSRTGKVALLFDTAKIDSTLGDIDYLSFDRFSNRLLMWDHGYSQIWQAPVTCGAIGVEAHLISQPGQMLSGASRPPSAAVQLADGRTEYVWNMRDVTAEGAQVCFSTTQKGFKLGEERKAIDSGFISFQNSFAAADVTVPLAVPKVRAANLVSVDAATDKPEYLANEFVQVKTTLANTNPVPVTGELRVDLYNAAGMQLNGVIHQGVTMAAGEVMLVDGAYNVGAQAPGLYTLRAVLSKDGTPQAQASTAFKVIGDQSQASARSTLALDKLKYGANERVTIASRAISQSTNIVLNNLTLNVKVVDRADVQLFARTYQINQLAAGRTLDFATQYQLRSAAAGSYRVLQTLLDAEGRSYGTETASFRIGAASDTGEGLVGAIDATPNPVRIGESAALIFSATNKGNSVLPDLALMVRIVDPVKKLVIAEFPYTQTIAVGANYGAATGWIATGTAGQNLVAVLIANVGGKPITLASQSFSLAASAQLPVKLGITQTFSSASRVLVLVSCNDEAKGEADQRNDHDKCDKHGHDDHGKWFKKDNHGHDDDHDKCDKHDNHGQHGDHDKCDKRDDHGQHSDHGDHDKCDKRDDNGQHGDHDKCDKHGDHGKCDKHGDHGQHGDHDKCDKHGDHDHHDDHGHHDGNCGGSKLPTCETRRSSTIAEALTALGVTHKITTNGDAFTRAMRSGLYNTYWLSGKEDKLKDSLPIEIREATFGGDALILDGVHDERNKVFDTVVGVRYRGKIGEQNLAINLTGPMYTPQRLATAGRAQKPELDGGKQQAVFDGGNPHANGPGIISHPYGSGQAVLFAFDLVSSLNAQGAWLPVLGTTLKAVLPAQMAVVAPGSVMRFKTGIANQASSTDVDVTSVLPNGAGYLDVSAPGAFDVLAKRAQWRYNLSVDEAEDLYLTMRAPAAAGSYSLDTDVKTVVNGLATPYGGRLAQVFTVSSAAQTASTAKAAMKSLALSRSADKRTRDRAVAQLDTALIAFNRNTETGYVSAIQSLLAVVELLEGLAPVNTSAPRLGVDRILREAQWRWSAIPVKP
jgi:sugar lactone lactonase YvrE